MLEHEDNSQQPSQPAAQARVKTEEFAHAVASIEARKLEEARRLEGTVVLGEAVKDLQLEIAPDEILAEVERNRRAAQSIHPAKSPKRHWRKLGEMQFTWRGLAYGFTLGLIGGWLLKPNILYTPAPAPAIQYPMPPVTVPVPTPPAPEFSPAPGAASLLPAPPPEPFRGTPLSQFPNEMQVYAPSTSLTGFPAKMDPGVSVLVEEANSTAGRVWSLIKHDGIVYARGWVIGQPTRAYLHSHYVILGSSKDAALYRPLFPGEPHQITFRVEQTHWKPGALSAGGWQTVSVKDAIINSHAWEKW